MSATLNHAERILDGRTFRLLTILPALNEDDPLLCECRSFDIDEAPPYEALSYVWGDSTPSANIWCNGQCIEIGPSLSQALKRLRYRESKRRIWADAICIDQADEGEKSHQVPLMGSIYSLARRVVVWLGEGDAQQIRLAFEASKTIADACHESDQRHGIIPDSFTTHDEVKLPEIAASPTILSSLEELYKRPWFSRIWCIQEIRLAADALVIWGDDEIPWSALAMGARWIFERDSPAGSGNYGIADKLALYGLDSAHAVNMSEEGTYPLLEALENFCDYDSSDLSDKVYGLLNIVTPRSEVEALGVDYTKDWDEIYADTVLVYIQLYARLTAFGYIDHHVFYNGPGTEEWRFIDHNLIYDGPDPENYDDIEHNLIYHDGPSPASEDDIEYRSWAPRWDSEHSRAPIGLPEYSCPWSACGEHERTITVGRLSALGDLCLKGVTYSKVSEVEEVMDHRNLADPKYIGGSNPTEDAREGIPDVKDVHAIGNPPRSHPFIRSYERTVVESFPEKFARTLTAGSWVVGSDKYLQLSEERARHSNACSRLLRRLINLQESGDQGEYAHDRDSALYESIAYRACGHRRLFWTEEGSYGLGPQCMRAGDIVVVLYGGNTPYVLRQRGSKYVFMGQAYVDEIMNGEVFQSSTSDVPEEQTFCLI